MKLGTFIHHRMFVGTNTPTGVSESRWRGMLRWLTTRQHLGEPLVWPVYHRNGEVRT
jgi:hypothetical protein